MPRLSRALPSLVALLAATACPQFIEPTADAGTVDAGAVHADAGHDAGEPPDACVPHTCAQLPEACGEQSDGCGGALTCGCGFARICSAPTAGTCGCAEPDWKVRFADTNANVGQLPALARDARGGIHLAYSDTNAGIKYAYLAPGAWGPEIEPLDPVGPADSSSIAVDAAGVVHVAYLKFQNQGGQFWDASLWYARRAPGGGWSRELVTECGQMLYVRGGATRLALEPDGTVQLLHFAWTNRDADLMVASKPKDGSWSSERIFDGGQVSTWDSTGTPGFAIDAAGTLHAAFYDYAARSLRHASRPAGGSWSLAAAAVAAPAAAGALVGLDASLAVDGRGLHLAFYSSLTQTTGELRYGLRGADGSWAFEPIDPPAGGTGNTGAFVSLGLDADGGPHVAYASQAKSSLEYAHRPAGGAWELQTIDDAGSVGAYAALLVEPGAVHVAYHEWVDYEHGKLKYAHRCFAAP